MTSADNGVRRSSLRTEAPAAHGRSGGISDRQHHLTSIVDPTPLGHRIMPLSSQRALYPHQPPETNSNKTFQPFFAKPLVVDRARLGIRRPVALRPCFTCPAHHSVCRLFAPPLPPINLPNHHTACCEFPYVRAPSASRVAPWAQPRPTVASAPDRVGDCKAPIRDSHSRGCSQ